MPTPSSAAAPGQLRNLDQRPLDNTGGVEALWYADVADVLHMPEPVAGVLSQPIVLRPGCYWYQLVAVQNTVRVSHDGKRDRHGEFFQHRIKGALAKATGALAAGLEAMDGRRYAVLYRDQNGEAWLVGTPGSPLSFLDKFDSGSPTERNGYDWQFAADTDARAVRYESSWVVSAVGLETGLELSAGAGGTVELRTAGGRLLAIVPAGLSIVLKSGFSLSYAIV